ncbi:hypothetical protein NEOLEDRAFT_1065216 [Neolentinus lepideus HHB14362 ss-1]|uniref:Zn(2)-C6 fungal-type domain-containing protein n=1 Tax=Neolentinus lepideus HHB14362 ss-1 TaxID=1314782 RepID=A0A165SKE3_9AGAM|nr:hypothetical protein NEOLEDRAFT_1065216 [Neolentinus lepideus HHB14362 ss-1]
MPPELSKGSGRRSHRKDALDGHQVLEIELKRSRGEISCAECRRLKIKCDKQVPCQSCRRRGCESLCPNDSLTTGQGTRSVLAATEHLYDQINSLTKRVRELEDALATSHAQVSSDPHPLLQQSGVPVATTPAINAQSGSSTPATEQHLSDFFGTLTVSENGVSRFFGPSGGVEVSIRHIAETSDAESVSKSPALPEAIMQFIQSFPFHLDGPVGSMHRMIQSYLPPYERALALCEAFGDRITWIYRCIAKSQLTEDLLPAIYSRAGYTPSEDCSGPHALALLFTVLAIGVVMEVTPTPNRVESERYFQLARASLCLRSILEKPSIATVQTFELLSVYMSMRGDDVVDRESRMESTWSFVTLAAHLSHTVSTNRDGERWGLPPKIVEQRRRLFWDIFVFDVWQSLITGRPMACNISSVDCQFPQAEDPVTTAGYVGIADVSSAEKWEFQFTATCVAEVAAQAVIPATPPYSKILELGRKVETFPVAPSYEQEPSDPPGSSKVSLKLSLLHFCLSHSREIILLYIHRSYFIQAITDHPDNPLLSEYDRSFLVTYRAASSILKTTREQFSRHPDVIAQVWYVWSFAFSAAVVFGAVVTKGPRCALAPAAMEELEQAYVLLTKAAPMSRRAAEALRIIVRLRKSAREALSAADKGVSEGAAGQDQTDDELSIFAGRASRVVARRRSRVRSSACPTPATSGSYVSTPDRPSTAHSPREDMAGPDWAYNYYDAYDGHYLPPPPPPPPAGSWGAFEMGHVVPMDVQWQQQQPFQATFFHHFEQPQPQLQGDARMDQRWTSFVRDNGLLDGANFL